MNAIFFEEGSFIVDQNGKDPDKGTGQAQRNACEYVFLIAGTWINLIRFSEGSRGDFDLDADTVVRFEHFVAGVKACVGAYGGRTIDVVVNDPTLPLRVKEFSNWVAAWKGLDPKEAPFSLVLEDLQNFEFITGQVVYNRDPKQRGLKDLISFLEFAILHGFRNPMKLPDFVAALTAV